MNRRRFLAVSSVGLLGGLAGCSAGGSDSEQTETATAPSGSGGSSSSETATDGGSPVPDGRTSVGGVDLPVPRDLLSRGAPKDAIPAIVDPTFADDWTGLELEYSSFSGTRTLKPRLQADDRVIGVERNEKARAYPLRILNWHEVVNDNFEGPLLVTYCPLCGSGVTAERRVRGETTTFGVSGLLWNSDLVMYDGLTESLWSQIAGTAIRGPQTGTVLSFVPSTLTTWEAWQTEHPDTKVLLPPPKSSTVTGRDSTRDYSVNPYGGYESSERIGIGRNNVDLGESGLHPKAQVIGVASGDAAKAYPLEAVEGAGVVNDTVGSLPVVVTVAADGFTLVAYDRRVDGATLEFERASDTHLRADGSRWSISSGRAVDGPHEGTRLASANDPSQMFWFAWKDFHPDSTVFEA